MRIFANELIQLKITGFTIFGAGTLILTDKRATVCAAGSSYLKYPCESFAHSESDSIACGHTLHGGWILATAILGSSLAFINGTVVNVALPSIQHGLNATVSGAQWVVESYALFLAALILLGGAMGDLYGRRLIFTMGILFFATASAWCGFAPNIRHLVAARALQGVGGAMLVPGSQDLPESRRPSVLSWAVGSCSISHGVGSSSLIFPLPWQS
jgi:hypothetical protein